MNQRPSPTTATIDRLIERLNSLPGIGPKSAQRLAYHILRAPDEYVSQLAEALLAIKQETRLCASCLNITDADTCSICRSAQREHNKLCVVEQPQDVLALEHIGVYRGLYHVLHGAISPTEGVGTDDIRIKELMERLKDNSVDEVILATNPTLEGEATAMYLQRLISPSGIKVTRLARGLPYGTELEYADDVTLTRALEERQEF